MAVRRDVRLVAAADAELSSVLGALAPQLLFVLMVLRDGRGAVLAANVRHTEDRLPALKGGHAILWGGEAEASRGECPFGPAVVDAGEVPVHRVWGGVAVELIADVDEVLDRCDVDVVDGREVEDDGFEGGLVRFDRDSFTAARARVVPWAILNNVLVKSTGKNGGAEGAHAEFGVGSRVGAAGFLEDGGDHVVKVVISIRIVEAF